MSDLHPRLLLTVSNVLWCLARHPRARSCSRQVEPGGAQGQLEREPETEDGPKRCKTADPIGNDDLDGP